jgi:hypothetical protein
MKPKLWIALITLTLALIRPDGFAFAPDNGSTRQTLRSLDGVRVVVAPLKWVVEKNGLTLDQLQKDTELKLRLAGIKVVSSEESAVTPGKPLLYVNAKVLKYGSLDRYIFNIKLELSQDVSLVRSPGVETSATTWSTSVTGTSHELSTIRDQLKELVDTFINAYLSVNPK